MPPHRAVRRPAGAIREPASPSSVTAALSVPCTKPPRVLFDPATKTEQLVESDPLNRVDFGGTIFSDVTNELVGTTYLDDRTRIYWKDPEWEKDYKFLQSKLPGTSSSSFPGYRL